MTGNTLFVMLGYGEDFGFGMRSLDFRTEEMLVDEACAAIQLIRQYNNFDGLEVSKALRKIAALWPSGHQQLSFSFGREGSPVLYIHFPYRKSNTEKFENREELINQSLNILKQCDPDELGQDYIGRHRAWLD